MIGIAEIQAPAWLGQTPDAWLKTQIKTDSTWDIAVSAGMSFRLEQEPPAEEIKTIIQDLLAGKSSNSWAHVAVWACRFYQKRIESLFSHVLNMKVKGSRSLSWTGSLPSCLEFF